jgi:naphthalene 1,2-dioxygenase ferredoxin component
MNRAVEDWVTVASTSDLKPGDVRGVTVGDLEVAVYNVEGQLYATDDICPHAYAHLSDGWLEDDVIECPLHAGRFEVKSGKGLGPPIPCDIKTFAVRVSGDDIQIDIGS